MTGLASMRCLNAVVESFVGVANSFSMRDLEPGGDVLDFG